MSSAGATLDIQPQGDALSFILKGRLDSESTGSVWRQAFQALERSPGRLRSIDAAGIDYCDGAGIGLLVELRRRGGPQVEIRGLADRFRPLLDLFPPTPAEALPPKPE